MIRDAIKVAIITGLRRGELFALRRRDVLEDQRAVVVRARKHPRSTQSRDEVVPLLGEAFEIVKERLVDENVDRIFPIDGTYASKQFAAACKTLGIEGLRWHDLRHEASSRLRDLGFEAIERQAILGHRTERMNARYTHVRVADLHRKYEGRG